MKKNCIVLVAFVAISALVSGCSENKPTSNTTTAVISTPVTGTIYSLSYNYENGKFSLIDVHVNPGDAPYRTGRIRPGYKYEVLSSRGEVLGSFGFDLPVVYYDYPPSGAGQLTGGISEQKILTGTILIPYFVNGTTIILYDPNGNRVLVVSVSKLTNN